MYIFLKVNFEFPKYFQFQNANLNFAYFF